MVGPKTNIPHQFSHLRDGDRRPTLVVGAGLSAGLVPTPNQLLDGWKIEAETSLSIGPIPIPAGSTTALYDWAEAALDELVVRSESLPKLRLAEALGLLTQDEWTAKVGLPLRGTMPRHRVIARFVREKKWASIWSLNWDTHLENALERIGLHRGKAHFQQPWITAYETVVTSDEIPLLSQSDDFFCILKPHGCVCALLEARECENDGDLDRAKKLSSRFMITKSELHKERSNKDDNKFFLEFRSQLAKNPLFVLGWSISEPYLQGVINESVKDYVNTGLKEELTIIDVHFNHEGHKKISDIYDLPKDSVFAELSKDPVEFDVDKFFMWLQSKYALDQLKKHAPDELQMRIGEYQSQLDKPVLDHFLMEWADDFLPAWTRLCWRAELVESANFEPHELRLDLEDEHVPWEIKPLMRPDLSAAAIVLCASADTGLVWSYTKFPGAFFDTVTGRLVVPLPAWGRLNDLAGLKPLLRVLEREIGYVSSLDVLPIPSRYGQVMLPDDHVDELKEAVASYMRVKRFSDPAHIGTADEFTVWAKPGHA